MGEIDDVGVIIDARILAVSQLPSIDPRQYYEYTLPGYSLTSTLHQHWPRVKDLGSKHLGSKYTCGTPTMHLLHCCYTQGIEIHSAHKMRYRVSELK